MCALAMACGVGTDTGADTSFSSGFPPSGGPSTGMDDTTGDDDTDTADTGSTSDGSTSGTTSDTNSDTGMDTSGSTTSGGDGGPACGGQGEIMVNGQSGPADANQNCPTTEFTAQVANAPGPIADVDIVINGASPHTGETTLWLRSPGGIEIKLFDKRGNSLTDDWVNTMFDDQSNMPVVNAPGPFHGCYQPEQALANFNGQNADGTWVLKVQNCLFQNNISSWTLHIDF
jgi:hypothetical protein